MTPSEQLAAFRSNHRIIEIDGRCAVDGLTVWRVKGGTMRHDTAEITKLVDQEYGVIWPSHAARIDAVAREKAKDILREDPYFDNDRRREAVERYLEDGARFDA